MRQLCGVGTFILGIESSCDDTAAAVLADGAVRANIISTQLVHREHGGVVPELASRQHQLYIARVVQQALTEANITPQDLAAVAYTQGPGLIGALHVGASFAQAFAFGLGIPAVPVNHIEGHLLSVFLQETQPEYPLAVLTVSGGHTQISLLESPTKIIPLGTTLDDAAGEAFDKIGKLMGLPYPAGPHIDRMAASGDAARHPFPFPSVSGYDFSFSGLKTAVLYYVRKQTAQDPEFLARELPHLAAGVQACIVGYLLKQLFAALEAHPHVRHVAIAGGVSANRELRQRFMDECNARGLQGHIPPFGYCTDNAAMIAYSGWVKWQAGFVPQPYTQPFAS